MNLILSKVLRFSVIPYLFISFVIFNDGGFVAIRQENGQVVQTATEVAFLPATDAARLDEGIFCEDAATLAQVLENFIS